MLFKEPISYFALVFFTFSYVLVDAGAKFANATVTDWYIKRKAVLIKKQKKTAMEDPAIPREKVTFYQRKYFFVISIMYIDRGYAYSGARGHDVLVTGTLSSRLQVVFRKMI